MKRIFMAALLLLGLAMPGWAARLRVTAPAAVHQGEPFFLEVRVNVPVEKMRLTWRGTDYTLRPQNGLCRTLLGAPNDGRLAGSVLPLLLEFDYNKKTIQVERKISVKLRKYPSETLKVAPRMVNPPKEELQRIAAERKAVKAALAVKSAGQVLPRVFVRPVINVPTSYYGKQRVYNGVVKGRHGGLDLRAAVGTPVKAAASGRVVRTGNHYYAGGSVYLDHGAGVVSSYFHLSKILVKKGARVKAGDVIALSGASGRVTGPHLHLGLYLSGTALDPLPLTGLAKFPQGVEALYEF